MFHRQGSVIAEVLIFMKFQFNESLNVLNSLMTAKLESVNGDYVSNVTGSSKWIRVYV